ncbi:2344_t:CDS:1 [Funneliformis mosseae]|uniref:2344_t:CDS:1 n=1 Tax=Funneliformis mosseae TaxID=27381 RepID=A0A9N8YTI5_FUNMO|nr:2344_t:CDS:1 [Funneliformis mosseae]
MVINQLQAQQQVGNDQLDTLDPMLYQDMTTILPYQVPNVINQPPGMITQQNITTQFGFASATSTYVENTVWHSTYAMSSHLTQPYYQYFPNTYSTLPPQPILIYPSYDDLVFQSQLDQLDGSGSGFIEYGDQSQSFGM